MNDPKERKPIDQGCLALMVVAMMAAVAIVAILVIARSCGCG